MEPTIVRDPVYHQLNARLKAMVTRAYRPGDKFLTEREIVEQFGVSRPTANKALTGLVSEGVLEFRKGVGTFVRRPAISYDVRSLVSFTEKARAVGKSPTTKVLNWQQITAENIEPEARQGLEISTGTVLWALDRLRLIDDIPVILEHRYIIQALCPRLTQAEVAGSLYQVWTDIHHLAIGGAEEVIRAVPLNRKEATRLKVSVRSPALEVTAVGFLADGRRLWWERTLYRADQYEFHSRLGPIQSATPARGQLRASAEARPE
jgi:GntR family transcriptional regulator